MMRFIEGEDRTQVTLCPNALTTRLRELALFDLGLDSCWRGWVSAGIWGSEARFILAAREVSARESDYVAAVSD